jgi:iron complex transport system ATP-binding protein
VTVAIGCRGVTVTAGDRRLLDDVDLSVTTGEWVAIVGPNGAGKTTLLRVLAGLAAAAGEVVIDDRPAAALSRRDRARVVAMVPQVPLIPEGIRVIDYVLLGRTPHIRPLGVEGVHDLVQVRDALKLLDLADLTDRVVTTLSGGERQRVLLARALAQESPIVLLDEPTTALDVGHQQQVLELIDDLRHERDLTVITTMHDLTLAGQYAERLVLVDRGSVVVDGSPAEVLTEANLSRFYGATVRIIDDDSGRPIVLPVREERP